jgi:phosphatidylglycerophosphatase B
MMTAEQYERWSAWWRAHEGALKALLAVNRGLRYLGYLMYPLLLVLVAIFDLPSLPKLVVVPLLGFLVVSGFRAAFDAPRPYELLDIDPLIKKATVGQSMPSRHLFSMTMIAMSWLYWCAPVGVVLLLLCVVMGYIRVVGGVHFPRDVFAGALGGIILGLSFWII